MSNDANENILNKLFNATSQSVPSSIEKEEKLKPSGPLTQYSMYGLGYMPTSKTTQTLKAGAYNIGYSQQGCFFIPTNLVTDSLIHFPDSKSDEVINEITKFWTLKEVFTKYGMSHKRGFLLWGPPGSGKSCTIAMVVKNMVEADGIVIIADQPGGLADLLPKLRMIEPTRNVVVIWEDLDSVIDHYGESEVLAILDGQIQVENIVFVATTNYPEKLDSRIVNRPSRFDKIVQIGMPNDAARTMYLEKKIQTTKGPEGEDLVAETKGMSIAHLRELIVGIYCFGQQIAEVIARLKKMKHKPVSGRDGTTLGLGSED